MKVAVIGAGIAGLTAGVRLAEMGHECDIYERWPGLGGQVATLDVGDGHLLERYYHHLFTSDLDIAELYEELGLDPIDWLPSSVAMFADGKSHPFTTPLDLLRFPAVSLITRLRMGVAVLMLQRRHREVEPFERMTAREWIQRAMGSQAWDRVWGPLLRGKFGDRADDISMAWLWSKLTLRRQIKGKEARQELLGYPQGGWQPLLERLRDIIEAHGGRVLIDRPVASLSRSDSGFEIAGGGAGSFRSGHDPRLFEPTGPSERYDAVLATVPSDVFDRMLVGELRDEVGEGYLEQANSIDYHTAMCVLLELDRRFSKFYWTNIADTSIPFVGLIEQTNLIGPEHYGGRRFLYIANYLAPEDPILELDQKAILDLYEPGLRRVNPSFQRDWIRNAWLFKEPAAQPIVTAGYRRRIPPLETPAAGLYLANTTQIYPEDRGTNYSVRLGADAARRIGETMPASAE
jgi:protoporphyrinogen oxidase